MRRAPCRRRAVWRLAVPVAFVTTAACIDFFEPDIDFAGAPAQLQLNVIVSNDTVVGVSAQLRPGFDEFGIPRHVPAPRLVVHDRSVEPDSARADGALPYLANWRIETGSVLDGVRLEMPVIERLSQPPALRWFGIRRGGADTVHVAAGQDLVLALERATEPGTPAPQIRQWFLNLRGSSGTFRVSADGVPPAEIRVPTGWLPLPFADGSVLADLIYYQNSNIVNSEANYVGTVTLDVRMNWVVRPQPQDAP